jgi:hypothetical protein
VIATRGEVKTGGHDLPPRPEISLDRQDLGCIRLQICGFLALFFRHLQRYVLDLVDVSMGLVQFETRHPPQYRSLLFFASFST